MKKVISGAATLIAGSIMFLSTFVAASNTGLIGGWTGSGRFWAAISENKLTPALVISIMIMLAGAAIMVSGNLRKSD